MDHAQNAPASGAPAVDGPNTGGVAVIDVRDLIFDYATARALFGVSLTIGRGTITGLVGPNGAGKTTLLRCIAALDTPFSGTVLVDGLDTTDHPRDVHRRIGYLQDFFGLYDELSVRQCLRHHAMAHGVPAEDREDRIVDTARRLDLGDRLDQEAGKLSRGLRQRLAVAQAIIHRPKVLLLDEPASGLDPEARSGLSELMVALRDEGITIVVSSHILAELEDYSTHMLILRQGLITRHCPIGEADRQSAERLRISLSAPDDRLPEVLAGLPGVGTVEAQPDGARITFEGDRAMRHDLLRRLVEAGLPVCSFHPEHRSMQDVYLERLDDAAEGQA